MKRIIFLSIVVLLIVGCSPCRRLARRCPPQVVHERYDSLVVRDSIVYLDRLVPFHIAGETQLANGPVLPVKETLNVPPIRLENTYAWAEAWIENSVLRLKLQQKDQIIKFRLDSADRISKHWEYLYKYDKQKDTVYVPAVPKFYKFCLKFTISTVIFVILAVVLYLGKAKIKNWVNKLFF